MSFHDHVRATSNDVQKSQQGVDSHRRLSLKSNFVINNWKKKVKKPILTKTEPLDIPDDVLDDTSNANQSPKLDKINDNNGLTTSVSQPSFSLPVSAMENSSNSNNIAKFHRRNVSFGDEQEISVTRDEVNENEQPVERVQQRKSGTTSESNKKTNRSQKKTRKLKNAESQKEEPRALKKQRSTAVIRTSFQLRDEDFHELFTHIPADEELIIAYPCAWKKDIYIHGRLYLSSNYLSFYACFVKWEESFSIRYQDIISVTEETPVKFVSKTIRMRAKNGQDYVCACYTSREKIYVSIFRLWQNVLLDQPLNYQQLRSAIYAYHENHDGSTGDSEESLAVENNDNFYNKPTATSQSLPENSNQSIESSSQTVKWRAPTRSSKKVNQSDSYLSVCTCSTHLAKQYANVILNYDVDTVFELICGDNLFTKDFHDSQNLFDYDHGEWRINGETGKRERQVIYKTINNSMLRSHTLICRDKQVVEVDEPHSMYVLNTEVYNEGMKYTDCFYVCTRFCMIQCDPEHSSLRITAEVRYVKSISTFVKSFIEKQVHSSIDQGVKEQVRRLESYKVGEGSPRSSQQLTLQAPTKSKQSPGNSSSKNQTKDKSSANIRTAPIFSISVTTKTITGKGTLYDIGLILIISFLLIHFYLWYKLHSIEDLMLKSEIICWNRCRATCSKDMNTNRDL